MCFGSESEGPDNEVHLCFSCCEKSTCLLCKQSTPDFHLSFDQYISESCHWGERTNCTFARILMFLPPTWILVILIKKAVLAFKSDVKTLKV